MLNRIWPTQNTESVDIKICHTFPTINHVVCYRRPECVNKLTSFKLKIQNTSWQMLLYALAQPTRHPAHAATTTTTCTPIHKWNNMVGRQDIPTYRDECSASPKKLLAQQPKNNIHQRPRWCIWQTSHLQNLNRALINCAPSSPIKPTQNIMDNAI